MKIDITIKIKDAAPADVEKVKKALEALSLPNNAETVEPN